MFFAVSCARSKPLIALSLFFALAGAVHASPITYVVTFTGGGSLGTDSFSFDAGGATNTTISSANLVNFVVPVGGINYIAQSSNDDAAVVNGLGLVTAVLSDLEPLGSMTMNPALMLATDNTYQLFDSSGSQIAGGTYQIAATPEPATFWLPWSGLLLWGGAMMRRRKRGARG